MGALPKRKPSTHRQGRRRSTQKLTLPKLTTCPECSEKKIAHQVCPTCGKWGRAKNEPKSEKRSETPGKKKSR
ncbi:MAG: 50S ribosomal protein L32 [Candidatus Shapirobacteria bacterium]